MSSTRALWLVALALATVTLASPLDLVAAQASEPTPPAGTRATDVGGTGILMESWIATPDGSTTPRNLTPGQSVLWHFRFSNANTTDLAVGLSAQTDATGVALTPANWTATALAPGAQLVRTFTVNVTDAAQAGPAVLNAVVEVRERADAAQVLADAASASTLTIQTQTLPPTVTPPVGPAVNWPLVAGAGAAVLVVGAGAGIALQRRRRRLRPVPRSAALRQQMLEKQLEKAKPKEAEVIREQIKQEEQVRVVSRERQILEAKRADAQRTIDLLRERHEAGKLTKLQFDRMAEKKRQDLAAIERELAEMDG